MWLKFNEVEQLGLTPQWIRKKVAKGDWESREIGERGRNGKPIREVKLESLPHELQIQYLKSEEWIVESGELEENIEEIESSLTTDSIEIERQLMEALKRYEPDVREAFLAEAHRLLEIVGRYELIEPKRRRNLATGKYEFVGEVLSLCREAVCTNSLILAVEPKRAKRPSPATLDGWMRKSKTEGLFAFIRSACSTPPSKADGRKAEISAEAVEWLNNNWRKFPSPRHIYKNLKKTSKRKNWVIPSETWIYRKYKNLPKIVSTKIFLGEKAYQSKFTPFVPRTVQDLEALQILCGDHSVRDLSVVLPDGTLTRPWLTLWQCLRTGLIWGWHLDITPSSQTIGLAYVNGVKNFGAQPIARPDQDFYSYLYTDQGKDYKSKTFTGQTLEFKKAAKIDGGLKVLTTQREVGFMNEMQLKHIMARGYNAKEKAVERLFRDISDWEQNFFETEYCGRDAKSHPDSWVRAWKRHSKLQKKFAGQPHIIVQESPFIDFDSYRENLAGFIHECNTAVHQRSVLGGHKTIPLDEFNRLYTTPYEIADDALALLLMKADRRMIGKDGIQMFQKHWYFLHPDMAEFKGEQVEVRYDDADYGRIYAILPNSKIVEAELVTPSSILNPNKKTMERIAKQQNHERKVIRDFQFITQSNFRGETAEDRVAQEDQQFVAQEEVQEIKRTGTDNGGATVHQFTRMNSPINKPKKPTQITKEEVSKIEIDDNIFTFPDKEKIKNEWED